MNPEILKKKLEYEKRKARAKEFKARLTCTICGEKAKLNCPCETTQCAPGARTGRGRRARTTRVNGSGAARSHATRPRRYCSTDCQRVDWRDRGHRAVCKKIRGERAAEAARAQAPTPPPTPPKEVFYGPAPRSHADEVRARIAAEHEAARVRREANPERQPESARYGSRCPICLDDWDVNAVPMIRMCCCRLVCRSCDEKIVGKPCPLCRSPELNSSAERLAALRRHVNNDMPEAVKHLASAYQHGDRDLGLVKSAKKAVKLYKRAVELGDTQAMVNLGSFYVGCHTGSGVKVDKKKAMQLFRMAADRGSPQGQCNLAAALMEENETEQAVPWYRRSAQQGFAFAQANLAVCYAHGITVDRDLDEAKRLCALAAAAGNEQARALLAQLQVDGVLDA